MTREDEIKARLEAVTAGPPGAEEDYGELYCHAPADLRYLLEENGRLRDVLDGVRPPDCTCCVEQLQEACGCGYELARAALGLKGGGR